MLVTNPTGEMADARLLTDVDDINALIAIFAGIAEQEGWQPGGELVAYRERSLYFGLYHQGELVGGLQLVKTDELRALPCQKVWPELEFAGRSDVAHVAMLAVAQTVRGKQGEDDGPSPFLFWLLCIAMWRWCQDNGINELWLEATPRTLGCYRRLGWPLMLRGALREHWGEPCYLVSLDLHTVAQNVAEKAACSRAYRHILALAEEAPSKFQQITRDGDERQPCLE